MIYELTDTRREREKKQEESELEEQTGHRTIAPTQTHREIAPHEAYRRLTDLVAHDPPITNLSFSIALSLYLNL